MVQHHSNRTRLKEGRPLGWQDRVEPSHCELESITWLRGDKRHIPKGQLPLPRASIANHPQEEIQGSSERDKGTPKATSPLPGAERMNGWEGRWSGGPVK